MLRVLQEEQQKTMVGAHTIGVKEINVFKMAAYKLKSREVILHSQYSFV